ncbi:uncharacterized protein [Elaeis guineensis]|uniref:uncharacterized protein n=2 Tax=Elaeis guineensis var. tenera TaxID=51953 RepID=UPI003C6D4FF9
MVSKRQKLARKRFKEANPHLFPKPPQDPSSSSKEKKNKKNKNLKTLKRKTMAKKKSGSALRKHPLRVPGMRPGESCFICKSNDHIAKLCPEKAQWEKNKICLLCRQRGHSLKNCPEKSDTKEKSLCYNCGEAGHSLLKCPHPLQDGGTKYANCFVCKEHGHLSKNCPKNTHGIYPKGGSCKICGEVTHLAKHCPNKGNKNSASSFGQQRTLGKPEESLLGQRIIYRSGDDLEDDFMEEDVRSGKTDTASDTGEVEKNMKQNQKRKRVLKLPQHPQSQFEPPRSCLMEGPPGLLLALQSSTFSSSLQSHPPKNIPLTVFQLFAFLPSPPSFSFPSHSSSFPRDWPIPHRKATMANSASGMAVNDECKLKFLELKAKRNFRFIIFKIDEKIQQVTVEKLGQPDESYDDFTASLPANECRYAVFDFDFVTDENCQKSKIFFISWSPDTSRVRSKMLYASSKDRFKRELDGIQVELQATDPSEMSLDIVKGRAF